MQHVSPAELARVTYDSKNWIPWTPDKWVNPFGGRAVSRIYDGAERETAVLRAWEWFHLSNGWLGIAYNYAIGQSGTLYRLRGEQRSGAKSGDADWDGKPENHEAWAVVFILGADHPIVGQYRSGGNVGMMVVVSDVHVPVETQVGGVGAVSFRAVHTSRGRSRNRVGDAASETCLTMNGDTPTNRCSGTIRITLS